MKDVSILLVDRPGALAAMGAALGASGISVEGGGMFVTGGVGVAHFLFHDSDADRAADVLRRAGITVDQVRDVLVQRLRQDVPGQLGAVCARMAAAGVNIQTMYSDHANQLILVVDDPDTGRKISAQWAAEV